MKTPRDILDAFDDETIANKLGVSVRRVMRAKTQGPLPASWYAGLCDLHEADLPRRLFTFKGMEDAA